jgi:ribosomal protein L20A (L18A)
MTTFTIRGAFYARRGYWQPFQKDHDATSDAEAREWVLSEIGSCHHVRRGQIRVDAITAAPAAQNPPASGR